MPTTTTVLTGPQRKTRGEKPATIDDGLPTVDVKLTINRDQFIRLAHLANANATQTTFLRVDCGVPDLILSLLNSLDAGIVRPGSHERACFSQLFGEALDTAVGAMYAAGGAS